MNSFIIYYIILMMGINITAKDQTKYYGHRGCRGIYPENTIEGFKKAIELGVDGIEWDVVVNNDNELIISHEPYIDTNYCKHLENLDLTKHTKQDLNIYKMSTEEIKKYDCGSKTHSAFPDQIKTTEYKPTFKEAESALKNYNGTILFEIKSEKKHINTFYPNPAEYATIIYEGVKNSKLLDQFIFMSFDPEVLNELNKYFPLSNYVILEYNPFNTYQKMLHSISFKPYAIGLNHSIISKKIIKKAHSDTVKVFAWTVNNKKDGRSLIRKGIDGIITDYPDIFISND